MDPIEKIPDDAYGVEVKKKLDHEFQDAFIKVESYNGLTTFEQNKEKPVHNWFSFTQAYSSELVERLIDRLRIETDEPILDPFVGVGTTPLAAKANGISSVGSDVSPLSVFVSRTKLRRYELEDVESLKQVIKEMEDDPPKSSSKQEYDFDILERAYDDSVLEAIIALKQRFDKIDLSPVRDLARLALLSELEELSKTRKHGSHYRFVDKNNPGVKVDPDLENISVGEAIIEKLEKMLDDIQTNQQRLSEFVDGTHSSQPEWYITQADARDLSWLSETNISPKHVISSPPYLNRNNYIAQYKIELALGEFVDSFEEYRELTKRTLRSHVEAEEVHKSDVSITEVGNIVKRLKKKDLNNDNIPSMVRGYFEDLELVLEEISRNIPAGGKVALVLGNVRWSGIVVPVDTILAKIAEQHGLNVLEIIISRFKGNSPQQMAEYGKVPVRESILVLEK